MKKTSVLIGKNQQWRVGGAVSIAAIAAVLAGEAAAQDEGAYQARETVRDTIVVTSRRREENLQDVPDSVSAFGETDIQRQDIRQVNDAIDVLPNISIIDSQDPGLSLINIRGIGQVRNGEPPVAIIVDGVQLVSVDIVNQDLFDVTSIEVLKGPQGALYGRNAIGGAIVVETREPGDEFEGFVEGRYANGSEVAAKAAFRGPIVDDKLFFSVAGSATSFDGLIENVTVRRPAPTTNGGGGLGEPVTVDNRSEANLLGKLIFKPTDRLSFDLRARYSYLDGGASYFIPLPPGEPNNTSIPVQNDEIGFATREHEEYSLKIDYDFDWFTLTSVTARSITDFFLHEDLDWLPESIFGLDQARYSSSWSEDLRIASPSDQRLRWMVGAYYLNIDKSINTTFLIETPAEGNLDLVVPTADTFEKNEAYAFYGQINYDIIDNLEFTAALRYDRDEREQTDFLSGGAVSKASFDSLQPKFSLAYRWSDNLLTYVSAGKGFRSGGFNAPGPVFPLVFNQEEARSIEVGAKANFADNLVTVNLAGFYTNYKDMQQFSLVQGLQGLFNVDDTDIFGFEMDAVIRPFENFDIFAAVGILDSEIKDFSSTIETAPGTVLVSPDNVIGNQISLMYGWSYRLGAQYTVNVTPEWDLVSRIDYRAQGDNFWHIDNLDREKERHIADASVTLENGPLAITAYVENLSNHDYTVEFYAQEWIALVSDIRWPNQPRRYGARIRYQF